MQDPGPSENDFITRLTAIVEEHLPDERFGVSELASRIGMSRSNLLRKVNKSAKLSVSQFIRQIRLQHAMELLKENAYNVSEVSYRVGFSSTSYFVKCFREFYGYPPGEVGKRGTGESSVTPKVQGGRKRRNLYFSATASLLIVIVVVLLLVLKPLGRKSIHIEKSIAVLPFINESNDSNNAYLINGIMESLLDNLQQIEDLRVISRTSVEKYRDNPRTAAEIAEELNVNYLVEGSGQKIGDKILLHIKLIAAVEDKQLWTEQFNREATDIFYLQMEVAKTIADEIQAIITPEEEARLKKPPTDDPVAYDYFLQGLDNFYKGTREGLTESITLFEMAIEHDGEFARAYADMSIAYTLLDWSQVHKKYRVQASEYAEKALLHDPTLSQSLVAKAVYYINGEEYIQAIPFLEKALEYNPNSALVINLLSDFYTSYVPDTEKYLEYALKGIRLDIGAHDSVDASYIYMHVSNALLQSGFIDEAETYIDQSLDFNPGNLYSEYVRAYILYAKNGDLPRTKELLLETLRKDTTRYDIIQEIGKIGYYMRDYESAYTYFKRFLQIKEALNLEVYRGEDAKIGLVFSKMGLQDEADSLFRAYKEYADNDMSMYKHLSLAVYYSHEGDPVKAIEHLDLFSQQKNFTYLLLPFLKMEPLFDPINGLPEFQRILDQMEVKFSRRHKDIKASLKAKDLI
jgi:TolB-like protein/AraC-like DNA-binding protein/Tfp pilus assembly protein PilF